MKKYILCDFLLYSMTIFLDGFWSYFFRSNLDFQDPSKRHLRAASWHLCAVLAGCLYPPQHGVERVS
jgi:hypothetical protein